MYIRFAMKLIIFLVTAFLIITFDIKSQNDYAESMKSCHELVFFQSQECVKGLHIPDFNVETIDGLKINRDTLIGKVVVINFWYMNCTPCIAELQGLNNVVSKYKSINDVMFLSFTIDSKEELEKDFFPNYKLDFKVVPNSEKLILEKFKNWWGYPCSFIIDKSGEVNEVIVGGNSNSLEASKEIEEKLTFKLDTLLGVKSN